MQTGLGKLQRKEPNKQRHKQKFQTFLILGKKNVHTKKCGQFWVLFFRIWAPEAPRTQNFHKLAIDPEFATINQNTKEAIGDIDGDGHLDLLLVPAERFRNGANHHIAWYKNPGAITNPWQKNIVQINRNNHHTAKLADMDADGDLDIIIGTPWSHEHIPVGIEIFYNEDGNGNFAPPEMIVSGKGLYTGVITDLQNDGDLDIVGQNTYSSNSKINYHA